MKTIKLPILDQEAAKQGEKSISSVFFEKEVSDLLLVQAVKSFLSNQRKARASAKTRGQVDGSSIKIWKQKGTGRARHGDRQAPIFVGGGKAHGPTGTQNYHQKFNKKANKLAVFKAFDQKVKAKKVFLLENLKITKTKEAAVFLGKTKEKHSLTNKIVLLHSSNDEIAKYFKNLAEISVQNAKTVNAYQLLNAKSIFLTSKGLAEIVNDSKND